MVGMGKLEKGKRAGKGMGKQGQGAYIGETGQGHQIDMLRGEEQCNTPLRYAHNLKKGAIMHGASVL